MKQIDQFPADAYLAAIVESTDAAIFAQDRRGVITSWNRAAEQMLGYTRAEAIGLAVAALVAPDHRAADAELVARAWNGEAVEPLDIVLLHRDGTRIETAMILSAICAADGTVIGVSRIARDIRDRREAELAQSRLAAIIDSSDDAIISKDLNGIVLSWNASAERLFGYTADEMIGQSITKIIPRERLSEEGVVLAHVRRGLRVDHFETVRQHKSGRLVDISLTVSPVRNRAGTIIGASKIARDIGERRRAELASLRLAAIVESADDVIVSKDLNGIVMSWNAAAERVFGYTAEEMIGRSITTIIPRDRLSEEDYVLGSIRAGRPVEHFQTIRQHKDGHLIDIALTVSPIRDSTGRVIGASKIARDVTEQNRLREAERIAIANEEAARRQVLEAENRRMQEATRLKGEFVANMSHELRTPLNSILGFAEMMSDERFGPLGAKYRQFARTILSSANHLLQLINDILDVAKVESGRIGFQPQVVDLTQVAREVQMAVAKMARDRQLVIDMTVDPAVGSVTIDPARLKQVLYNYLSNAIKFSNTGGQISVRIGPEGDDRFRIAVEDHGIGIRDEDIPRLFVEFQQLDSSTTKRAQGTGLGLALTKRIVEAQGGAVGVDSRFGSGSTFWATLPRHVAVRSADVTSRRKRQIA